MGNLKDEVNKVSLKYVQEISKLKVGSAEAQNAIADFKVFADAVKQINEGDAKTEEARVKAEELKIKQAEAETKAKEADIKAEELKIKAKEADIHEAENQIKANQVEASLANAEADQKLRKQENDIKAKEIKSRERMQKHHDWLDVGAKAGGVGAAIGLTLWTTYVAETGLFTQKAGWAWIQKIFQPKI